jgi:predicted lipoprotein with Yx(FWY)xxD motif
MQANSHRTPASKDTARGVSRNRMIVAAVTMGALGIAGLLTAGSIASNATSVAGNATQSSATVSLRKTALGTILVKSNGHTLYLFGKDRNGKSSCSASCAQFWPPLLSQSKPTAGLGVQASLLDTTKRSNGSKQVTYNKHPLYSYALDKQASQTKGEGSLAFGAKWYAISAKGTAIVKAPTTTATTTTTSCAYPPCP